MNDYTLLAADLVGIAALVLLFLVRHGRRELVVAYLGVNVGVLAVTTALATTSVSAGLGLGLFGVLSIIRLRSDELAQREIAYYFAALTLGLLGGLASGSTWLHVALMAAVLVAIWVGDHPVVAPAATSHEVRLDRAITDPGELRLRLEALLDAEVLEVQARRTDLVEDTTLVRVRALPRPVPSADLTEAP